MTRARITIERVGAWSGAKTVFRVVLDERQVAVIPPGQARTVETTPGDHALDIRIRRKRSSPSLALHLSAGQEVRVRCRVAKTAFQALMRLDFSTEDAVAVEIIDG